nr:leucine-rich repeat protein [Saccharofermentans sp.]
MSIKLWPREKKEYTQSRFIKPGDIFSFYYENQYYFFGRIIFVKPKEFCLAELFDYYSEKPEIDEQTILNAKRMMTPFNIDTKFTFHDKLMKWDWRIIGHQEGFVAPDQDELFFAYWDAEIGWTKVDLYGNSVKIPDEDESKYIHMRRNDHQKKAIQEAILQKLRNETPKVDPATTNEEELYRYADLLFDSKKYAEVIDVVSAFPEDKLTRRLSGLLACAFNSSGKYEEAKACLDKHKALFSEDMYNWYYFYGFALLQNKEYEKLPPIIELGLEECEKAYAAGKLSHNEYGAEKGHFNYFRYRREEALKEQGTSQFINGFVIRDEKLIRYEGDTNVEEIVIPDGVKRVSMSSFAHNKTIKSLVFPEGVEYIDGFRDISNVERIVFPSTLKFLWYGSLEDTKWYQAQPKGQIICGKALYRYTGDEEEVIIEDGVEAVVSYAFRFNRQLRKVVVPDSCKTLWAGVFSNCTNLSEVVLPKCIEFISSNA